MKNILLVLIVFAMIPEILLVTYLFNINISVPQVYANNFFKFLVNNPLFFVTVIIIIIMLFILYFTLRLH